MRRRNPSVTELVWAEQMQDEGDLYAVERPRITGRVIVKALLVAGLVYVLLTAALAFGA